MNMAKITHEIKDNLRVDCKKATAIKKNLNMQNDAIA